MQCDDCEFISIGQTGRNFKIIYEYNQHVKIYKSNNVFLMTLNIIIIRITYLL